MIALLVADLRAAAAAVDTTKVAGMRTLTTTTMATAATEATMLLQHRACHTTTVLNVWSATLSRLTTYARSARKFACAPFAAIQIATCKTIHGVRCASKVKLLQARKSFAVGILTTSRIGLNYTTCRQRGASISIVEEYTHKRSLVLVCPFNSVSFKVSIAVCCAWFLLANLQIP